MKLVTVIVLLGLLMVGTHVGPGYGGVAHGEDEEGYDAREVGKVHLLRVAAVSARVGEATTWGRVKALFR